MRTTTPTESFYHKALSALLALVMHGGLLFLLVVGVQWATVSNAPLTAQLWSSGDLLSATDAGQSTESIMVDASDVPSEPVEITPPDTAPQLPETDTKPLIEPAPATKPSAIEGDIKIETEKKEEKKPERQKPETKPETSADNAKPTSQKPANTQARQQRDREQALRDRLARERASLDSNNPDNTAGTASGGGTGPGSGGMGSAMLARAEQTYKDKIRTIILANTTYPPNFLERLEGNPQAVFVVKLLADGTIGSVVLRQSSGNPTFDRIVRSAIDKTGRLPLPERAEILPTREVILSFRPRDN